jgi:dienelactone hydrolase
VVLCPPLGLDYLQAHYALRRLAERLCVHGLIAVRFDYDGTGDSAGDNHDPDRVEAWLSSITAALDLVHRSCAGSVNLVGMRLGATLAAAAASSDRRIDGLVLWDPYASGKVYLSEQRALAALSIGVEAARDDGAVETPGLVHGPDTVSALRKLRIDALPGPLARRVLVLLRTGRSPDRLMAERLRSEHTEWADAEGQDKLIDWEGRYLPEATIDRIVTWVSAGAPGARTAIHPPTPAAAAVVAATAAGDAVVERPLTLGPLGLFGLLTEVPGLSTTAPVVVLLNVALGHHIGPNRLWVQWARSWAAAGLRVARVDLSGLGESPTRPGQAEFVSRAPEAFDDVAAIARALSPADPSDVVLVGLCSSAYQALDSALSVRPRGVVAINPVLSFQPPEVLAGAPMDPRRTVALPRGRVVQAFHHEGPLSPMRRRLPDLGWRIRLLVVPRRRPGTWLKRLCGSGVDVFLICAEREARPIRHGASARTLAQLTASGRFRFSYVPDLDHGLLRADQRDETTALITEYLLGRFGPGAPTGSPQQPHGP